MKNRAKNKLKIWAVMLAPLEQHRRGIFRRLRKAQAISPQRLKKELYLLRGMCKTCGLLRAEGDASFCKAHREKETPNNTVAVRARRDVQNFVREGGGEMKVEYYYAKNKLKEGS